MWYRLLLCKRYLEDLLIFPFVWAGRKKAHAFIPNKPYEIIFFFPFFHTGGAEKVHAQIAQALSHKKGLIIFTRRSVNASFLNAFKQTGHDIIDVSNLTDDRRHYWRNLYYRGLFSGYINALEGPVVVFNGHSNFAYKLSRWLKKSVYQIELIHSYNSFSAIRIPFLPFYHKTVMVSRNRIQDHLHQYRRLKIPSTYDQRIQYIQNAIELPSIRSGRHLTPGHLRVMYVGRGSPEKRVWLAGEIAREARKAGVHITMTFVGDVGKELSDDNRKFDVFCGNVSDPEKLGNLYRNSADVLLITSTEEALPMVMLEAMARGSVIIATPVGDIPLHVANGRNGFLFSTSTNEQQIVREGVEYLRQLLSNPVLLEKMSTNNLEQAYEQYDLSTFDQAYRSLIESHLQ